MMESAITAESSCGVEHGGSQQNGTILGNGCACFLAKVLATIAKDGVEAIWDLAVEDATEHGRLIELKALLPGLEKEILPMM